MSESTPGPLVAGTAVFTDWRPAPGATLRIEILDVTYADAPSVVHARSDISLSAAEPGPVPFEIWGAEPDPGASYVVTVTVTAPGEEAVIGRTTQSHPVITFGYPAREIEVPVAATPSGRAG